MLRLKPKQICNTGPEVDGKRGPPFVAVPIVLLRIGGETQRVSRGIHGTYDE